MKRIRIVGLCLVAVFAFGTIGASSALALPEVLFKFTKGNIEEGGTFTSKGTTVSRLVTLGGSKVECKTVKNNGSFHNAHLGLVLILFEGCTTKGLFGETLNCTTAGQPTGHIHLLNLLFHLGLAHNQSGTNTTIPAIIILLPSGGIEFGCEVVTVKVIGNVIGALNKTGTNEELKVNEKRKDADLVYNQTNGMQELTLILLSLGGGTLTNQHLESTIFTKEESAQESRDTLEEFKNSKGEATEIELVEG